MRQRKRPIQYLFLSILSFLALIYIVLFIPPTQQIQFLNSHFSILIAFFMSLFLLCFSLTTYFFKSKTHGLLLGLFVVGIFVFRITNLTHPFFFILLAALFLTLELLFTYRK